MERRLSQDKLAEKAGCSARTITEIEGGTVGMSIERLLTLRQLLHTTPDEVLLGEDTGGESWLHAQLTRLTPKQRRMAIVAPSLESLSADPAEPEEPFRKGAKIFIRGGGGRTAFAPSVPRPGGV